MKLKLAKIGTIEADLNDMELEIQNRFLVQGLSNEEVDRLLYRQQQLDLMRKLHRAITLIGLSFSTTMNDEAIRKELQTLLGTFKNG